MWWWTYIIQTCVVLQARQCWLDMQVGWGCGAVVQSAH